MQMRLIDVRARLLTLLLIAVTGLAVSACGGSSSSSSSSSASASSSAPAASSTSSAVASSSTTASASNCPSTASVPTTSGPTMGFESVPLEKGPPLGCASTTGSTPVDGIQCAPIEQLAYHIHAHLAVFKDGVLYSLPGGVGIPGSQMVNSQEGPVAAGGQCYYWLHTHTNDGVIHIESPTKRIYSLGQFFDEWHQPLSASQVGVVHGKITAFVNGNLWKSSVRAIPLLPHEDIQFNIGDPAPPIVKVDWARTGL